MIDVPEHLTEEQQKAVDELSRTMGADPRSALFPNGQAPRDAASTGSKAGES